MTERVASERTVEIVNRAGLHARPAAAFVKVAGGYEAEIKVQKGGVEVNGKSILGVLMLAAEHGSAITIRAQGDDAEAAVDALCSLVESGFEEE